MSELSNKELIQQEIVKISQQIKESLVDIKVIALAEAWKILQLFIAIVIQVIERFGDDLSSPEKKELALQTIESFYDNVLSHIDIPAVPSAIEPMLHGYLKKIIMVFVGASIDAMVATFRNVGVFKEKYINTQSAENTPVDKLLEDILKIVRAE